MLWMVNQMDLTDVMVLAINKVITCRNVCVVVPTLDLLKRESKGVLMQHGVRFVGAFDKNGLRRDCHRMDGQTFDDVYLCNVEPSCYAAKYMRYRLNNNGHSTLHFYFGVI